MEDVLGVLLHLGRVSMPPGRMDGIAVDETAVHEAGVTRQPRLLPKLPQRRLDGRLPIVEAAGDGLPETSRFTAQELQYLVVVRVDDNQD